ncbi:MAG TPA: biotin/lipoate--protein ligase family protein [Stellaceae bacterium]|nr:biotin/lipoate--protein ligase family protein [Stellaceae bacterium]
MRLGKGQPAGNRFERALDLPPLFRPLVLREVGDAFAHAIANAGALGAGALIYVGRFNLAEFAVVLEPEQPLHAARLAFYVGMVALADALAALAPPEKPITIDWPDAIRIDGGLVGGGRLGWPPAAMEDAVPDWLVFGAAIRIVSISESGPGLYPLATALQDEGFGEIGAERFIETFARHLMAATDRWQDGGVSPLIREYAARLDKGVGIEIDGKGDAHVQRGRPTTRSLVSALKQPTWLDLETAEPRL